MDDNIIVVGVSLDDGMGPDSGAAYVFRYDHGSWSLEQELKASDGEAFDRFGHSAAVHGEVIILGAWRNDAAYVFRRVGGRCVEETKLTSRNDNGGGFGRSISFDGRRALVGAPNRSGGRSVTGAAYVLEIHSKR